MNYQIYDTQRVIKTNIFTPCNSCTNHLYYEKLIMDEDCWKILNNTNKRRKQFIQIYFMASGTFIRIYFMALGMTIMTIGIVTLHNMIELRNTTASWATRTGTESVWMVRKSIKQNRPSLMQKEFPLRSHPALPMHQHLYK